MVNFIEFPIFDGVSGDLRAWISWLEDFFVRERFTEDEKMNLAQSLLEGEANAWFYSSRKRFAFQSWEHLVVELLLWRFGAFGDGGVFSDLELFLLWNKYDRILRKRRKRMETTSITPQESISSPATIHETVPIDKFSNQQVDEISGDKKDESHEATLVTVLDNLEEASVTQNQVPVSKLEPSLQIPKDSPNVCENSQAVVGCEHQRSFQKNIRMDVVNGVVERSPRVMSITKNVSAHQVLDKMCQLKGLEAKKKMKVLKSWMFKYKPERRQSKKQHNQDGLYTWSRGGRRKNKGAKLQIFSKHKLHNQWFAMVADNIHTLPRKPATSSSMLPLYVYQMGVSDIQVSDKEMVADPVSLQLILDDLKSHMRHKWKSKHLRAVFDLQTSPSYALDVVNKTSKLWETQKTFTSTHVASVNSFSFAVGTADNFELCVGHEKRIMRRKLLLHSGCDGEKLPELDFHFGVNHGLLVFPWNLMLLEFLLFLHLEDKVCLSAASNSCYGWMVFDRGKNIKILGDVITLKRDDQTMLVVKAKDVHVDSLVVRMKLILSCGVALEKQIQWAEIQRLSLYKELWIENMVEITTGVSWAELKWIIWSVSSTIVEAAKVNVNFETRHGVCIILIFKSEPKLEGNHDMRGLLGISMSYFGDTGSVLVMVLYFNLEGKKWYTKRQQTSSSTWHRWRRKD